MGGGGDTNVRWMDMGSLNVTPFIDLYLWGIQCTRTDGTHAMSSLGSAQSVVSVSSSVSC